MEKRTIDTKKRIQLFELLKKQKTGLTTNTILMVLNISSIESLYVHVHRFNKENSVFSIVNKYGIYKLSLKEDVPSFLFSIKEKKLKKFLSKKRYKKK